MPDTEQSDILNSTSGNPDTDLLSVMRQDIEAVVGRKMRTPKDFDFLSETVFGKMHQTISATTLKRLWGYFKENVTPRRSSLDLLAQFLDYSDWNDFCQRRFAQDSGDVTMPSSQRHMHITRWHVLGALLLLAVGLILELRSRNVANENDRYTIRKGQRFESCEAYLSLFGIRPSDTPWHEQLPHHPNITVWGPQYHNPNWHNDGNPDSLMPTITEYWEPTEIEDSQAVRSVLSKMNREGYYMSRRLNEVRITFMRDLIDSSYVFLGVYRFSLEHSDTTHIVWERVADECNLNQLSYLEQLQN